MIKSKIYPHRHDTSAQCILGPTTLTQRNEPRFSYSYSTLLTSWLANRDVDESHDILPESVYTTIDTCG